MLKQPSSKNHRGKRLRPKHSLQVFLLVAISIWLMYQLAHSYNKRRVVPVETDSDGMDGGLARRRLGRKDLVDFAGHASGEDDVLGIGGGGSNVGSEDDVERDFAPDRSSKGKGGEGGGSDEEDEESDEDDDGLPGDEEGDGKDFQLENGDGDDELKTTRLKTGRANVFGNADDGTHSHQPNELEGRVVRQVNATDGVQDGAAVPLVNGAAADGIDMTPELNSSSLSNSDLSENSSSDVLFNGREATGNVAKNLLFNDVAVGVPGAEKPTNHASADEKRMVNQYWIADSVKTGSDKAEDVSKAESGDGYATQDNTILPAD